MCSCTARTCQLMLGTKHTALFPLDSISLPAAVACLGRGLLFRGASAGSLGLTARCSGLSPLSEGLPSAPRAIAYLRHVLHPLVAGLPCCRRVRCLLAAGLPCRRLVRHFPPSLVECLRSHCLPLSHVPVWLCLVWLPRRPLRDVRFSQAPARLKWWVCCVSSCPSAFVEAYCGASMLLSIPATLLG